MRPEPTWPGALFQSTTEGRCTPRKTIAIRKTETLKTTSALYSGSCGPGIIIGIPQTLPELYQNRATALVAQGRLKAALHDLRTYLQLCPHADDRAEVEQQITLLEDGQYDIAAVA